MVSNDDLRALAEQATPGEWYVDRHGVGSDTMLWVRPRDGDLWGICEVGAPYAPRAQEDAAYIAAASPARVLELLAEVERLRAALDLAHTTLLQVRTEKLSELEWLNAFEQRVKPLMDENERLREEVVDLKACFEDRLSND